MSKCPTGKRFKPLPLRRGFWREFPKKISEGIVLISENMEEGEDIRNTAQSVLIDVIGPRLRRTFRRPELDRGKEFYEEFFLVYRQAIHAEELRIWEEVSSELDISLAERLDRDLTPVEAAYLSYTMLGYEDPPQSHELYMNMAVFSRAYEELVKEKYGGRYTSSLFYEAMRAHMPSFILRLISMDSATSEILTVNAQPRDKESERGLLILESDTVILAHYMEIGEDNSFSFDPIFVEMVHEHMYRQGIREDGTGRTEDRGCPVLYTSGRDAIIRFAIEEIIEQHKAYNRAD